MSKQAISIAILVIFHFVGIIGILTPYSEFFISLSPYHLLLTLGVVLYNSNLSQSFLINILIIGIGTWLIESVGVNSGKIFGEYSYGDVLGIKVLNAPLLIGVNWVILVLCFSSIISKISDKLVFSLIGAFLMTALDVLIEPVAIKLLYWLWKGHDVPLQNYVAWFIISFAIFYYFSDSIKGKVNKKIALSTIICQVVFFIILGIAK